VQHSRHV